MRTAGGNWQLRTHFVNESEKKTQNERAAALRSCELPQADGSMRFYRMHQLWELAADLPIRKIRLAEIEGFDEVVWFGGPRNLRPTCREIAEHARDIFAADVSNLRQSRRLELA
ncbi:MAG: hypothetical protein V9H26_16995 [Verrucomicrobiota bacterium]